MGFRVHSGSRASVCALQAGRLRGWGICECLLAVAVIGLRGLLRGSVVLSRTVFLLMALGTFLARGDHARSAYAKLQTCKGDTLRVESGQVTIQSGRQSTGQGDTEGRDRQNGKTDKAWHTRATKRKKTANIGRHL